MPKAYSTPVKIRRHAFAKHITLRLSPCGREIRLTIPRHSHEKKAMAFLREQRHWLADQLARRHPHIPFEPGVTLPLFGRSTRLRHNPRKQGVEFRDGILTVGGTIEHFPRRVRDWIRQEARRRFSATAFELAERIGKRPAAVVLRDTSSRWGSCSRERRINLCWRLAFAPQAVARYIIAHEVAHLAHFDHSPAFWTKVSQLHRGYKSASAWLSAHGQSLHRYG